MVVLTQISNLRKTSILLRALEATGKDMDYYALDLDLKELNRTLEQVPNFKHVKCHGLHGTYDNGLEWLKMPENRSRSKCIMFMGSSIGRLSCLMSHRFFLIIMRRKFSSSRCCLLPSWIC
jgi:uncharacterized SAM-dependent methyltransferase